MADSLYVVSRLIHSNARWPSFESTIGRLYLLHSPLRGNYILNKSDIVVRTLEAIVCNLTNPAFTNEDKAREFLKASRWPDGAFARIVVNRIL
jgi:hypothetical protein